jgi:ankyrin repeat protein/beta-lactamase regulating signal transducer with metallopeptidase domain
MTPELDILMKVTMVLLAGLIASGLASRARASVRHLLLASTLGALIGLPLAAAMAPDLVVGIQLPRVGDSVAAPAAATVRSRTQAPASAERLVPPATTSLDGPRRAWESSTGISIPAALRLLWAAGAVLLFAGLATALWRVQQLHHGGIPWIDGQAMAETLARDSGIGRPLTVLLHEQVPAPVTWGWRRPAIVLPMDARNWSDSDLRRAFVHELEHVRRGDWPVQLAARAICAAYWFHPLVWVAWRRLCLESERACDDAVVVRAEQADYADQLVTLAERLSRSHSQPVLAMANRSDLSVRVRSVLDGTQLRGRAGAPLIAATLAAASVFVLALATVRVEAVPDQRANAARGRTAADNDRGRTSTLVVNAALVEAAQKGRIDEVSELLNEGVDVNAVVHGDGTALLVAAREGHRELVRLLLDRGADTDIGVAGDGNALTMAAREGNREIVALLLDRGASPDAGVAGDGNALTMAAREGFRDIVALLLDRGADVNAGVEGDGNALIMAAREGHLAIVTMLLDRGARIEEVVAGDENALISASGSGQLEVVRLLVARGANVNARVWAETGWTDRQGEWRTPLNMARRGGHTAVVNYLQSVGAVE